jgi:hypothetical protein
VRWLLANKRSIIKWVIGSLIVLLLIIVIVLSLTPAGTPQSNVDYIAEYNRINKPVDFDPNDNAAPYFDKAFAIMAESPNEITKLYKLWPGDLNDYQLQAVRKWVESNRQTIDYLQQAAQKPYYWKPVNDYNAPLIDQDMNDLKKFRNAVYLLRLDAKLKARQGQIEPALQESIDIYKTGEFLTGPKFLIEQLVGIAISASAVQSAFQILDHTKPSLDLLEKFQKQIVLLSSNQPFIINYSSEKLLCLNSFDWILAGRDQATSSKNPSVSLKRLLWITIEKYQANKLFNYMATVRLKTPWQLHKEGVNLDDMAGRIVKVSILMRILTPAFSRALHYSYRCDIETNALIATTAILRYKAEKGHLPKDLQTLVTDGFLDKLPMDPFSNGPLVYKPANDNFILYSVAQDFNDNGGKHDPKWAEKVNGDYVFWPVQSVGSTSNPQQKE